MAFPPVTIPSGSFQEEMAPVQIVFQLGTTVSPFCILILLLPRSSRLDAWYV